MKKRLPKIQIFRFPRSLQAPKIREREPINPRATQNEREL
jgi:hypothetical protein